MCIWLIQLCLCGACLRCMRFLFVFFVVLYLYTCIFIYLRRCVFVYLLTFLSAFHPRCRLPAAQCHLCLPCRAVHVWPSFDCLHLQSVVDFARANRVLLWVFRRELQSAQSRAGPDVVSLHGEQTEPNGRTTIRTKEKSRRA